jgi:hypothetical protein
MKIRIPDKSRVLISAIALFLISESLDFITSALGMAFLKGAVEANSWVADPKTHKFVALKAFEIKGLYTLYRLVLPTVFIWAGTGSYFLASLVWWYAAWGSLAAVWSNTVMFVI